MGYVRDDSSLSWNSQQKKGVNSKTLLLGFLWLPTNFCYCSEKGLLLLEQRVFLDIPGEGACSQDIALAFFEYGDEYACLVANVREHVLVE